MPTHCVRRATSIILRNFVSDLPLVLRWGWKLGWESSFTHSNCFSVRQTETWCLGWRVKTHQFTSILYRTNLRFHELHRSFMNKRAVCEVRRTTWKSNKSTPIVDNGLQNWYLWEENILRAVIWKFCASHRVCPRDTDLLHFQVAHRTVPRTPLS